jgi:hypothetical protein
MIDQPLANIINICQHSTTIKESINHPLSSNHDWGFPKTGVPPVIVQVTKTMTWYSWCLGIPQKKPPQNACGLESQSSHEIFGDIQIYSASISLGDVKN